ncbi:MAG: universal stress protein [Deltaproteobacteria bacterium]
MEYRSILCPTDGTEISDAALQHAAYLSKITGAKVILLHVVEKWYHSAHLVTNSDEWQTIHEDWLNKGRSTLVDEAAKLKEYGAVHIETILRDGDASHEIIATAIERMASVVIMATHRYSPVGKIFIGSVTDRVAKKTPCPILWVFPNLSNE